MSMYLCNDNVIFLAYGVDNMLAHDCVCVEFAFNYTFFI